MPDRNTGRTALITGATSGLGAGFARHLAAQGYDLVLVARDRGRLAETAAELTARHGVAVTPLAADLATDDGCSADERSVCGRDQSGRPARQQRRLQPEHPVPSGRPSTGSVELLRVNVEAVMRLTLAVLPGMVARGHGGVINVSSVAGFFAAMPGSTYPATKAWVTNFSQSVALSVRRKGVRVMAVCPGYVRTEFHSRAGIDMSRIPSWLWLDVDTVVRAALADLRRGVVVSVPTWRYKLVVALGRLAPLKLQERVARDTRGR